MPVLNQLNQKTVQVVGIVNPTLRLDKYMTNRWNSARLIQHHIIQSPNRYDVICCIGRGTQ